MVVVVVVVVVIVVVMVVVVVVVVVVIMVVVIVAVVAVFFFPLRAPHCVGRGRRIYVYYIYMIYLPARYTSEGSIIYVYIYSTYHEHTFPHVSINKSHDEHQLFLFSRRSLLD